ncbi:MAG: hypothetical protein ABI537_11965 [Casimicrobiaceae bacterium]
MLRLLRSVALLLALLVSAQASADALPNVVRADRVPLGGHVLPALASAVSSATVRAIGPADGRDADLALTVVLRRTDPAGFQAFLQDVTRRHLPGRGWMAPGKKSVWSPSVLFSEAMSPTS